MRRSAHEDRLRECAVKYTPCLEVILTELNIGIPSFRMLYCIRIRKRDKGYTVKYNPLPEGVPNGTPEGKGVYLTVHPKLSPNMDSISF